MSNFLCKCCGEQFQRKYFYHAPILAFVIGGREAKTTRKPYKQPGKKQIDWFCTDDWKSFKNVFPVELHLIGKAFTKHLEGVNNAIRTFLRRSFRKTEGFH